MKSDARVLRECRRVGMSEDSVGARFRRSVMAVTSWPRSRQSRTQMAAWRSAPPPSKGCGEDADAHRDRPGVKALRGVGRGSA